MSTKMSHATVNGWSTSLAKSKKRTAWWWVVVGGGDDGGWWEITQSLSKDKYQGRPIFLDSG